MSIGCVTFGVLFGATAAVCVLAAGGGLLLAFATYSLAGSLGLLSMALSGLALRQ